MDFSFLGSTRFWVLVVGALGIAAQDNFSVAGYLKGLEVFVAGFIAIRTTDRFSETINS